MMSWNDENPRPPMSPRDAVRIAILIAIAFALLTFGLAKTDAAAPDIQVEVSHVSKCSSLDIHQCDDLWLVQEFSHAINGQTLTDEITERVSFYGDLPSAQAYIAALGEEFTTEVEYVQVIP